MPIKKTGTDNKSAQFQATRYQFIGTLLAAVLGLVGVAITAYFGYLGMRMQTEVPISATQTAEATIVQLAESLSSTITAAAVAPGFQGGTPVVSDPEYVIVQPSCNCSVYLGPWERVMVRLRWGAKTASLADQGADLLNYTLLINGQPVPNIDKYRKPAVYTEEAPTENDPDDTWWVYWDYPVDINVSTQGTVIKAVLAVPTAIDTGWDVIPAGTEKSFQVSLGQLALTVPALIAPTPLSANITTTVEPTVTLVPP